MKTVLAAWLLASVMVHGLDASALKIELLTGESLAITRISKVEPDGITVWTDSGVEKIPVSKLAGSELARFSLSEEKARIHAAAVAKQETAYYAHLERERLTTFTPAKPPQPKFITVDQVKTHWLKNLVQPRILERNYRSKMAAHRSSISKIRSRHHDLDAREIAATYNKAKAIEIGNTELANIYEAELVRISHAKIAAAELTQTEQRNAELHRLNEELANLRDRMSHCECDR
jgi:hypothetical protein